jgi:hypothetical protein
LLYNLITAAFFGFLFGEAARPRSPGALWIAGLIGLVGVFVSLAVPPRVFAFTNDNQAAVVLTRLTWRALVGSALVFLTTVLVWLLVGRLTDPGLMEELYLLALAGIFLVHGFGELVTRHAMYLQQTHQYNSNQLFAALLGVTLLLFILILYFLAFDLARPPELHVALRDLGAITLVLLVYGRSVYAMAHH